MEVTEDFYLVLPSNSSMLYHPDNTSFCYTTYLPREIHLRGNKWTVGLVELRIPNTIEHIADDETLYRIDGIEDENIYQLKPGVYEHMRDFIEMINAAPGIKNHHAFKPSTARHVKVTTRSSAYVNVRAPTRSLFMIKLLKYSVSRAMALL